MKLNIPATAFATLLSGKPVLSKSDTILYTEAATKTDSEIKMELQKSLLEQKKMLLKTFHQKAQESYLSTPAKTCDPTTTANHGILGCPANQVCIGDPTSLLGGVCTEAVHETGDSSAGYVDGSKTIFGGNSYDEVYEMNERNEHVDGSVGSNYGGNAIEMFEGVAYDGEKGDVEGIKYGDIGGNNGRIKSDAGLSDGGVWSNNGEEVNMISDEYGVSDSEMVNHVRLKVEQKYLQLREMMKSKSSLKKLMLQGGSVVTTKKECKPTSASPDTGILNCPINQVCIQDSASMLGGVCAKVVHGNASLAQDEVGEDIVAMVVEDQDVVVGGNFVAEAQPGGKALKPFAVKDKLNAERILKGSRAGLEEYLPSVSGECSPGTNDGFVDVGILNGCDVGHVCVRDPHSNIGGTCVNIGGTSDTSRISRGLFGGVKHRHLLTCDYLNGTSGEKCSGMHACGDLSSDFIANNIGCGSCNAFGACRGLTATSSVGEGSCNGGNACRGGTFTTSTLTVNDQSCNQYYACSYGEGYAYISDKSCVGVYACMGLIGNSTIGEESCNKDGACQDLSVAMTVTPANPLLIKAVMISSLAQKHLGTLRLGLEAATIHTHNCCNGEGACMGVTSANMTVLQDSCNMKEACRGSSGECNFVPHK
eukprot:scaffold3343_cov51-Cyclotella_meneghiniana.AAC.3